MKKRKIVFYCILILFVIIAVEVLAYGTFYLKYGEFSYVGIQKIRSDIISGVEQHLNTQSTSENNNYLKNRKFLLRHVIHPYLGFIDEGIDLTISCPQNEDCDRRIKRYEDSPFVRESEDHLIVGVLGGSFAFGVSYGSTPKLLENELKKIDRFKDREKVIVYHMASGGYKQPQQVMALNYYLSLGAHFDVVINIDGFNEIVLPAEPISKGVHPIYPRSWYYLMDDAMEPELLSIYGKREYLKKRKVRWAEYFINPVARHCITANLIWNANNTRLQHIIEQTNVDIVEYEQKNDIRKSYSVTGPAYSYNSWEIYYDDMSKIWSRGSQQLLSLCKGLGIEFYHFLQPNQYVEGSKPIGQMERKKALAVHSGYGKRAKAGYSYLIKEGKRLKESGVPFTDLTMIFSDNADPLYIDNCCHLNKDGYDIVVKEVAKTIGSFNSQSG